MADDERDRGLYDGVSSRMIPADELRAFLLDCFGVSEGELLLCRNADVPSDATVPVVYRYHPSEPGHFQMGFDLSIPGSMVERVSRQEFMRRFAARFEVNVLYGGFVEEPLPWLWSLAVPDGRVLLVSIDEGDDQLRLTAASGPVPELPDVPVNERLGAPE